MKLKEVLKEYKGIRFIADQDGMFIEILKEGKESYYKDCEVIKSSPFYDYMLHRVQVKRRRAK